MQKFWEGQCTVPWPDVYNAARPVHLDVGCAHGKFALQLAQARPDLNILGVEIRAKLLEYCIMTRDSVLGSPSNLHYLLANINAQIDHLLRDVPGGGLASVTILHPDPWFQKKHHKRRFYEKN